jgi:hypothetical protein
MGYRKDEMTGHGFRHMASTLLHERGYKSGKPLGARAVGWLESKIDDWLAAQIERSRKSLDASAAP